MNSTLNPSNSANMEDFVHRGFGSPPLFLLAWGRRSLTLGLQEDTSCNLLADVEAFPVGHVSSLGTQHDNALSNLYPPWEIFFVYIKPKRIFKI